MDSQIYLPRSEKLNIGYLSHAFDNKNDTSCAIKTIARNYGKDD